MSRNPPQHNPYQDPFSTPAAATGRPRLDSESDMEHYDRRDTFQSENSNNGGGYDNNQNYDPYCKHFSLVFCTRCPRLTRACVANHRRGDTDTESEQDVYNRNYAPSAESLNPGFRSGVSDISNPTVDYGAAGVREPYPAWTSERQIPLSKEYVYLIYSLPVLYFIVKFILTRLFLPPGKSKTYFSI